MGTGEACNLVKFFNLLVYKSKLEHHSFQASSSIQNNLFSFDLPKYALGLVWSVKGKKLVATAPDFNF